MQTSSISRVTGWTLWALIVGITGATQAQTYGQSSGAPAPAARTYAAPATPPQPAPRATASTTPPPAREPESTLPDLIYIQPFVGYGYVHLKALDADNFNIDSPETGAEDVVVTSKGSGLRYGVGAGFNIVFIHLGGRVSFTQLDAFTLGTGELEVALAPRLGPIEPSARVAIGYAWVGDANYGDYTKTTDIYGLSVSAGLGLDARLGQVVGIGVALDASLLNMSRSTDLSEATTVRVADGSAVGVQVALTGHLTLHI